MVDMIERMWWATCKWHNVKHIDDRRYPLSMRRTTWSLLTMWPYGSPYILETRDNWPVEFFNYFVRNGVNCPVVIVMYRSYRCNFLLGFAGCWPKRHMFQSADRSHYRLWEAMARLWAKRAHSRNHWAHCFRTAPGKMSYQFYGLVGILLTIVWFWHSFEMCRHDSSASQCPWRSAHWQILRSVRCRVWSVKCSVWSAE